MSSRPASAKCRICGDPKSMTGVETQCPRCDWHASRGVPPAALQALMGWAQLAVADKYVRLTGTATSRALNDAHGD